MASTIRLGLVLVTMGWIVSGCGSQSEPRRELPPAPSAKVVPTELAKHGHVRTDDYYWLKERENPEVIAYLEAENDYTEQAMAHTAGLRKSLFDEMVGRIKKDDSSVPYREGDYWYYTRYEGEGEYPIYCRRKESLDADEEVILDVNELAEGHEYYAVRGVEVSSGQNLLAFAVDTQGRRIYDIRFKNLATGEILDDRIEDVTANLAWAEDDETLFYARQDPETLRFEKIFRHRLGSPVADDVLVHHETDETFSSYVFKTKSKRYVMIASVQTLSTEFRYLEAAEPESKPRIFLERRRDHEYSVDHFGDDFYVRTNDDAKNFRLMKTPVTDTSQAAWSEVISHRDDVLLEGFEIFAGHLVVVERKEGLIQLRVRPWDGGDEHYLDFGEPAYMAWIDKNPELDTTVLRYGYTSLTTPRSVFDYDMKSRTKELKKQEEVLGGFDRDDYLSERIWATARDGAKVPISVVYRKDLPRESGNPLVLYGYGSYGASMDATFRSDRLSLLDRGFIYALAHIRGGEELGRQWYEDGKLLNKKNTFTDFIDCGEHLVEAGYADPERMYAMGGSAGGLLVGAVINMRPDLFDGVVAAVPFVDVVTTMLDDSIPLTTGEYDEWGNPNEKRYYDYILSYSPYDNVEAKDYPNLLVTTGLHDSQVQYWEPAKWVAKLRTMKTGDNLLLLKTNMDAGHGGASGRFKPYEERALAYAFLIDLAGVTQ